MWSTLSDRAIAEDRLRRERQSREDARTAGLTVAERLERFMKEEPGQETEEVLDLLSAALAEMSRLTALVERAD